jgi:hypothetical protein
VVNKKRQHAVAVDDACQSTGAPTWPRLDLTPPEFMLLELRNWGSVILAASKYLNDTDRLVVEQAVQQLNSALDQRRVIDADTARIAAAAYVIGAHGAMTGTAFTFFKHGDAELMRFRKATTGKEQRLRDAIKAELKGGSTPSEHPYKDAGSILEKVNRRLPEHERVSIDAIYRRLKPRSSRARTTCVTITARNEIKATQNTLKRKVFFNEPRHSNI